MLRNDNIIDLNDYLEENHRKNRKRDMAFFARVAVNWNPLTDQNLDDSIASLDPYQPVEKDKLVLYPDNHTKPKSERYTIHSITEAKAKAKRGRPRKVTI